MSTATMSEPTRADIGILVVDDDRSLRMILTELFRDAGFWVDEAESPFEAVQKLGISKYDLIFSDINMPGMTGIELLAELRRARNEVRVVIMTADASLDTAIEATRLGAQDYLRKPFQNLDQVLNLADKIADDIRKERAQAAAVESLVAAAKSSSDEGGGDLAALAEKAERILGIKVDVPGARPSGTPKTKQELAGDIAEFPLHEILQLLGMMRKTGILRVSPPGTHQAALAVVLGEVHAAKFGPVIDLKALYRLLANDRGMFHFQPTPQPPAPQRIQERTEFVIMEAMRQMDELGALGNARPPDDLVLRYNGALHAPGAAAAEDPIDLKIAERLRTPHTVRQLLDAMPVPDLDIYNALIRLRKANALTFSRPPAPAAVG